LTRTLAAVDLGAQSGRVVVGRFDGARLAVEEVHRFANVPVENDGVLEWDWPRLEADVFEGLGRAGAGGQVESVAVDSWGVDFGLVDAAGRLLRNPTHYRNRRRASVFDSVIDQIPARELYERTAIQLMPINTLFELAAAAAERDPTLAEARRLLMIPDLFHQRLCGSQVTERTNATTTQCYDPHARDWARDLLDQLGVPTTILPDVAPTGSRLGAIGTEAGAGLDGAIVVATATHDTAAAVAAVPMTGRQCAYLSVGTWSLVGIESDEPIAGEAAYRANLSNEGGVDGTFRVLRNVTGLWLLEECRRVWAEAGRPYSVSDLVARAATAPALRSFVDPNDPTFTEPGDMPARIAAYCKSTHQEVPADDAAVVRCIIESLALKHAQTIDLLADVAQREIDELHVVGGGANNELLCSWTAQAAQRPVLAGPSEATAVGNLLVQAVALGELSTIAEGRELVRRSFAPKAYEPAADARWQQARERFAELASARPRVEVTT